jgi:hypothetical protein
MFILLREARSSKGLFPVRNALPITRRNSNDQELNQKLVEKSEHKGTEITELNRRLERFERLINEKNETTPPVTRVRSTPVDWCVSDPA